MNRNGFRFCSNLKTKITYKKIIKSRINCFKMEVPIIYKSLYMMPIWLLVSDLLRYHIETSPLICSENQWTGFYMIVTSVMKVLMNIQANSGNLLLNRHCSDRNLPTKYFDDVNWNKIILGETFFYRHFVGYSTIFQKQFILPNWFLRKRSRVYFDKLKMQK